MSRVTAYGFQAIYNQSYKYHAMPCPSPDTCPSPVMIVAAHPAKKLVLHALSIVYCATDSRPACIAAGRAFVYGTGRLREDALCGEWGHFERCNETWPTADESHRFFRVSVLTSCVNLNELERRVEFVNWFDDNPPIDLRNYAEMSQQRCNARSKWRDFCADTLGPAGAFARPAVV